MKSKFHSGEIAVQTRAGVQNTASRVAGVIRSTMPPVAQDFLSSQPMVVLSTLDTNGLVWASILTGKPGFMQVLDERTVRINAASIPGDPLSENLKTRDEFGILVIEFETRRRMKVKGKAQLKEGEIYIYTECICPLS